MDAIPAGMRRDDKLVARYEVNAGACMAAVCECAGAIRGHGRGHIFAAAEVSRESRRSRRPVGERGLDMIPGSYIPKL